MEKNINRILIVVIIIFLIILSCMKIIAFEYKYDTNLKGYTTTRYNFSSAQDTIIARDGDGYDKKINLSSNEFNTTSSYIYVAQGQYTEPAYHKGRATSEPCDLGANCKSNGHKGTVVTSIVHQPNVWCVQHGISLDSGDYKVGGKKVVQSPALAYILNQRNINMLPKDWVDAPQIALWLYLYNAKEGKVNNVNLSDVEYIHSIFGNIACGSKPTTSSKGVTASLLKKAENIYNNAINYENNFANLTTKPVIKKIENSNGNIHIEVSDTTKYEIYIGGVKYSEKSGENTITQFTSTSKDIPISTIMNLVSNGKISLKEGKVEIYIKACDSIKYEASYRVLAHKNNSEQRIIVVIAKKTTNTDNKSESIEMPIDANVSMQKYITSVSDINGKNQTIVDSRDSYLSRENDMNNNDSDSLGVVYKTKYDRDPSKSKSKKTPYKYDNPVKIDYGDKVTYTIEVSNNGAYPVENVVIRDAFPKIGDNIVVDINSIELNKNGNEMNTSSIPNSGMNYLISNSIAAGETKKFTITMKFNSEALKQRTDIIANTAWVEAVYSNVNGSVGLKGKNLKRDYRTADRDYVQMKQYAVSLEKYVVGVNGYRLEDFDNNGKVDGKQDAQLLLEYNSNIELTDSVKNKIYRYGDLNKDREINPADSLFLKRMITGKESIQNCREGSAIWYDTTSKYKENYPVQVETGDKVTFKIKLTNKGEGNIKVSKIKDTFTNDATKKLILKSITGNGEGTISGNIITFNNPLEIKAGESTFIEVTFEVTTENLNSEHGLNNTAEINEMKNRNDQSILSWDNDGTDNNKDTDYLKVLKQYAVGLNKFITKVNNADLITNTDNLLYNYNSTDRSGLSKTDKSTDANKVRVEPGDTVIYTLRLTNTSPTDRGHSAIKVSKIEDIPQKINNNCYLDYDSSYEIKENGGGTVAKNENKLTITFSEPEEIYPGKYLDITIRFKVVVKDAATATYQTLENTATVTEIKNRNNITVNDVDGTGNNSNSDYIKTKIYAVDLKKFVSKVEYTGKTNSETLVTKTDDPGYNCANKERENYSGQDKEKDPVRVEPGDLVTFTIRLINTGINADGKADYKNYGAIKVEQITDTIPNYCNYEGNIIGNGGGTVSGDKINFNNAQLINPGAFIDIEVTFKVNVPLEQTGTQQTMVNKAYVNNIIYNRHDKVNDSDNKRNYDHDYIKTKIYAVGIEKYVTGVGTKDNANSLVTNPNNINYNCATADRSGKERQAKKDDAVRVEPGDYVTFTIKVKNTGTDYVNYGKISTTTISESFTKNANCKLVYDSTSAQKDNESDKIKFSPEGGIEPGKAATFTIKFRVEVTGDLTGTQQNLENTATISDKDVITNKNTVEVKDSDRDKNNTDSDYLRTKIYKVALEKYVTQVNDNALSKDAGANYNVKSLSERNGNPIYDSTNKENDIVNLETGDTVTFAIIVKNIGDNYINYGTIKTLEITDESSTKLQYNKVCQGARYNNGTITGVPSIAVGNEATIYLGYTVTLDPTKTKEKIDLVNTATINSNTIKNKHDVLVKEDKNSRQDEDNTDSDYLRTKVYAVSLEKYVSKVVDKSGNDITDKIKMGPQKEGMDRPREGYAEHNYNNSETTEENCDKTKRRNPVTTVTGDTITYTIKLKNDSEAKTGIDTTKDSNNDKNSYNTAIKIGNVIDYLPNGMQYDNNKYTNDNYKVTYDFETSNGQTLTSGRLLQPGETATVTITAEVIEDKMSLNILKNVAEINEDSLTNKNGSKVYDTTENNNRDADYIQLNYKHDPNPNNPDANPDPGNNAFFAGTVWNDMAPDKESEYYNTIMDNSERKLSGIKVDLYRNSYKKENNEMDYTPITKTIVATTITDENGNYLFGDQDIHLENQRENYIKGPKISNEDNRWAGYYGYYIVFTYDGITYTSTNNGIYFEDIYNSTKDYTKDSNASEYNVNESEISGYTTRKDFNSKFATINNSTKIQDKEIQYDRVNESGYIPESTYKYDPEIMSMKSLTKEIDLSTFMGMGTDKCLERSKYIGLGLRGRDIFDLELTSDVSKVEVKVNGITGTYDYTNKIGVRRGDVEENYYEDMANKYISKMKEDYVGDLNGDKGQQIRQTDVKDIESRDTARGTPVTNYNTNQLLQNIFVTYKITVTNASKTEGEATKVINYFDRNYKNDSSHISVKGGSINEINSYGKYNSVLIDATSDEIYITYELDNARDKLKSLGSGQLKTYNMAEIYEYTTTQYGDKDERTYTKGILDKDSAPGSARIENTRLTDEQISEATTVDYYFGATNLNKLKYEDDTYATPTLYFTTPGSIRVLSGTVFEDYTDVYTTDRTRTGNGVKDDIEPGIKGAKVQLLEGCSKETYDAQTDTNLKYKQGRRDYYVVRYQTTTDKNGEFKFTNYLPGNYIMRYFYGDNQETFYIGDTNTKSYNGEDFQATNNYQEVDGAGVHILPTNENYWYTYNYDEGVSTATDIADMRKQVSTAACELSDDEMELLNNVRDGKVKVPEAGKREDGTISSLRDKLDMQAKTKQFTLTVEKSIKGKQNDEFDVYEVNKMNFGIAEVPVTTIDLQKHVNSFEIKDSTVENTIASAEITDKYIVEINKHNITDKNKYNKVKAALEKAGVDHSLAEYNTSEYGDSAKNENILVSSSVKKDKVDNLRGYLITYSIPNIITITPTWKTVGNVLPGVKTTNTVLDVSIEDAKLQGAKLKITYDIAVSMYAEKDFSGTESLQPSIDKVIDLIDNGVSYSDLLNSEGQWKVANASELKRGDSDPSETSGLESYPSTEFTTTIIESDSSNELLAIRAGYTESTSVTVERVLTSQDTSIQDIITSSIDAFEYQNTVKILQLDYTNSKVKIDGEEIKNKDRIRTPERYIIVPGKHHDSATSETIAIHPPTGDTSTHTMYYIIGAAGLTVLAIGAFGIKKFVLKGKSTKK